MAHVRQSRPDSGLGGRAEGLKNIYVVPFSLCRGLELNPRFPEAYNNLANFHREVETGTTSMILRPLARTPRPESGLDYLMCAMFRTFVFGSGVHE